MRHRQIRLGAHLDQAGDGAVELEGLAPLVRAIELMRFGRRRAWKQVGYGIAGWAAGLANTRGVPRWMGA